MKLTEWQSKVRTQLQQSAHWLRQATPGMAYGALATCTLLPLVAAHQQFDGAATQAIAQIFGGIGLNLFSQQLATWFGKSDEELATLLGQKAAEAPAWRQAFDELLQRVETPKVAQAVLSEADWARFAQLLKQDVAQLGSTLDLHIDLKLDGDVAGDVITGTIAPGVKGAVIGKDITQTIYERVDKLVEHEEHHHYTTDPVAPDPAQLRAAYLNRLYSQANKLALDGVDPGAASGESKMQLGAVYTALLTLTPEAHERWIGSGGQGRREERLSAVAQLDRERKLVLLGDPGSGKSTFVNFVALCLTGEALGENANLALLTAPLPDDEEAAERDKDKKAKPQPWRHGPLLPIRVILRDFAATGLPAVAAKATADHLWAFIAAELAGATLDAYVPHLQRELLAQGGVILLDGLDEVPDADRRRIQIKEAITDFVATYHKCRVLVTSRTYAYQNQEWQLPGFREAVLAPLTDGQIRRFVDRWYAHMAEVRPLDPKDAQGKAAILKRAIATSARLHELAERPLLLTLTASLHAWRGGSLPERREELYSAAVNLLLDWWEQQRVVRDATGTIRVIQPSLAEWLKVDRDRVRALLNRLAYEAHTNQPTLVGTADIAEKELVYGLYELGKANPAVNEERIIEYLRDRAGLLTPRGVRVYTFPHRTFQEYLAACHLTDTDEYPDNIAGLARQEPNRWREVALLAGAKAITGLKGSIWSLVDALCYCEPVEAAHSHADSWGALLAGSALVESADLTRSNDRQQRTLARVRRGLVHGLRQSALPALERAEAGRLLAKLGDPRSQVMTLDAMEFCFIPVGPFIMGSKQGEGPGEDPLAFGDEEPQHTYDIKHDYWLARYPLTNAQYAQFVDDNGYTNPAYWTEAAAHGYWQDGQFQERNQPEFYGDPFHLPNHPVVGISWYEALAYTRWLTERLPQGWQVRLPSEAEWEKGARGGKQIPQAAVIRSLNEVTEAEPVEAGVGTSGNATGAGAAAASTSSASALYPASVILIDNPNPIRRYTWGDEIDPEKLNYNETNIGSTSAVGAFPGGASPFGVEEMNGNVREWTGSLAGKDYNFDFRYPYDALGGRENLAADAQFMRVVRGGSFANIYNYARAASRYWSNPDFRDLNVGVRLVLSPSALVSVPLSSEI